MKYLIKDTSTEERKKLVENALAISLLDANAPSNKTNHLVKKYINGEMEIEQIKRIVINHYRNLAN